MGEGDTWEPREHLGNKRSRGHVAKIAELYREEKLRGWRGLETGVGGKSARITLYQVMVSRERLVARVDFGMLD